MTGKFTNRINVDGQSYEAAFNIVSDGGIRIDKTGDNVLPAAKIGQLTTRTDANTGVITMVTGHGITTGQRLDVYWVNTTPGDGVHGARRGVTSVVSGDAITIDLGAGDNLPNNLTAITASVAQEEEFLKTGDDLAYLFARATRRSLIVFADAADAELFAIVGELDTTIGGAYQWRDPAEAPVASDGGVTNPLAGEDIAKVFLSNGDSAGTCTAQVGCGAN